MPIKPAWTENQSLVAAQTLTASGTDTDDLDITTGGYDLVDIQWKGTFNASASEGCTIEILSSSDSGTTEDTIPIFSIEVSVDAGATSVITIPVKDLSYIAVKRTNNDSTYSITNETIIYSGRYWEST